MVPEGARWARLCSTHAGPRLGRNKLLVLNRVLRLTSSTAAVTRVPHAPCRLGHGREGFSADLSDLGQGLKDRPWRKWQSPGVSPRAQARFLWTILWGSGGSHVAGHVPQVGLTATPALRSVPKPCLHGAPLRAGAPETLCACGPSPC